MRVLFDRLEELVEGVGEELDAIGSELVGHLFHRDAGSGEVGHGFARAVQIFGQALTRLAVIAEGVKRGRRDGVDGVGADQFFDVDDVAVILIFGAGAGPENTLRLRAFGG